MSTVLALSIPFFALVFLGMFARSIGFITQGGALTLSKFAFFIALPPMMFVKGAPKNLVSPDILDDIDTYSRQRHSVWGPGTRHAR